MEKILLLSVSEENFTSPPKSELFTEIDFSFKEFVPVVLRLLQLDANLARVHAKISPKMNEEIFWRNYYVRIIYLRAIIGMDGPEAKERYGSIPESEVITGIDNHPLSSTSIPTSNDIQEAELSKNKNDIQQKTNHSSDQPQSSNINSRNRIASPDLASKQHETSNRVGAPTTATQSSSLNSNGFKAIATSPYASSLSPIEPPYHRAGLDHISSPKYIEHSFQSPDRISPDEDGLDGRYDIIDELDAEVK